VNTIEAKAGCCEEASPFSGSIYIPCNKLATRRVYHARDLREYRMCAACADHNIRNRGAEDRGPIDGTPVDDASPIGHNLGTVPTPEAIAEYLADTYQGDKKRAEEFLDALGRVPAEIGDEETNKRAADFAKKIASHIKVLEGDHKGEKQPYLDGGRAVDGFFKTLIDRLGVAKKDVERRQTVFANKKAAEERRRREEEARLAKEAADRAAREALERAAQLPADAAEAVLEDAIAAEDQAEAAVEAAQASQADLSRTRTDLGVVSSLRTTWKGEMVNRDELDLEKLRPYIPTDALERAINAFVKAGGRELRGANIFENSTVVNR